MLLQNFHTTFLLCALTISSSHFKADATPLWEMSPRHHFQPNASRTDRNLLVERRRVSGSGRLVITFHYTVRSGKERETERERAPRPPDTWRQTHRRGITESAGTALLPEPSGQTCSRPDRGYLVSKTASKAVLRKISLWLVRWEGDRRMFVW